MEPPIENIEDCQQLTFWVGRAALDLSLKPAPGPHCFPSFKKRYRQFKLGTEVAVKAGLGTPRLREDRIDPNLVDPVPRKEIIGRVDKPLAGPEVCASRSQMVSLPSTQLAELFRLYPGTSVTFVERKTQARASI